MRFWRFIKDILNDEDLFDLNDENALDNTDNPESSSSNETGDQSESSDGSESNSSNETGDQSNSSDGSDSNSLNETGDQSESSDSSESNSSNETGDQSDSSDGSDSNSSNESGDQSDSSGSSESSSSNETGDQSESSGSESNSSNETGDQPGSSGSNSSSSNESKEKSNSNDSSKGNSSNESGEQSVSSNRLKDSSSSKTENQSDTGDNSNNNISNEISSNNDLSNKDFKNNQNKDNSSNNNLSSDSNKSYVDVTDKNNKNSNQLDENNSKDSLSNDKSSDKNYNKSNYNDKLTNEQKLELYKKLKESIKEIQERKKRKLEREKLHSGKSDVENSEEEKYELSEETNNFLNQLGELPPFEERDRGAGYSIDTLSTTEIPESIVRTLITKFLNQRFCKKNTDLNIRSNSLEKTNGFHKWEIKDVIVHLETHQVTKVLTDKYGYQYADGKNENVPLSFYFDMSGSMSNYTNMLAVIAIELLKKDVKVLIGYNERVNVQIEKIEKTISVEELAEVLKSANYYDSAYKSSFKKDKRVIYKYIHRNIDNYLIEKKCEKCVVFSDFDPIAEVINLSHAASVYWFCFENSFSGYNLGKYRGFIYKVKNAYDLEQGLIKVNQKRFETLVYTENPKNLQKKIGVRK